MSENQRIGPPPHGSAAGLTTARALLLACVLAAVSSMLIGAFVRATDGERIPELACWLLPNGQVMTNPASSGCPLRMLEAVNGVQAEGRRIPILDTRDLHTLLPRSGRAIRVSVSRAGSSTWADVPIIYTTRAERIARASAAAIGVVLMLSIPVFLLWRSRSRAATALTLVYGSASIALVALLAGQHSPWMTRGAVGALILAPAALTHLAFVFPKERAVLEDVPALVWIPYSAAAVLVPVGWVALERDPLLGPAFLSLLILLGAGAWLVLLFSCWLAIRESESAMDRARARVVFLGALLGPLLPTLALATSARSLTGVGVSYLWCAAALMPLPIALAISRYNLFDLGWDVRRAVVRVVYIGISALAVSLVFFAASAITDAPGTLSDMASLYLISFLAVSAIEVLRARTPGLLETVMEPRLRHLRTAREALESELATLQDEDEISRQLGVALRHGVGARNGGVLLSTATDWRPAYWFGAARSSWPIALQEGLLALAEESVVQLPAHPELESGAPALREARIEVVATIAQPGARYGIALVGRARRSPYAGVEMDFIREVTTRAAIALHNARLSSELIAAERQATTGRLAVALAHDLGKDLGWLRRLARRLPERFEDRKRLTRDALMIRELSDGLADVVARFVRGSTQLVPEEDFEPLDLLVDRAIRRVSRTHGPDRVTYNVDPSLQRAGFHEHLERVMGNLLDNALHASPPEATVHLFASADDDAVRITIEDQGMGIPRAMEDQVLEAGVSTRLREGGSGVGLTVAREILDALGGTLQLEPGSECGTRATIRIPLRKEADGAVE